MDPSVKKIINNAAFIASLAPELAIVTADGRMRVAAQTLGRVAAIYAKMLISYKPTVIEEEWEGCEQAQLLIKWIAAEPNSIAPVSNKVVLMDEWTSEIWSAITNLADGKLPA